MSKISNQLQNVKVFLSQSKWNHKLEALRSVNYISVFYGSSQYFQRFLPLLWQQVWQLLHLQQWNGQSSGKNHQPWHLFWY